MKAKMFSPLFFSLLSPSSRLLPLLFPCPFKVCVTRSMCFYCLSIRSLCRVYWWDFPNLTLNGPRHAASCVEVRQDFPPLSQLALFNVGAIRICKLRVISRVSFPYFANYQLLCSTFLHSQLSHVTDLCHKRESVIG